MAVFSHPPPVTKQCLITFPSPDILLVRINRSQTLNCLNRDAHDELHNIWTWLDQEPTLRVGIITGDERAFCAGADIKGYYPSPDPQSGISSLSTEWHAASAASSNEPAARHNLPDTGFGGLSRRRGKKPILAAVQGICFGGGLEMVVNCDMVVCSPDAKFALPEVKRGVVANSGALPRLMRTVGRQRAMEVALTGRTVSAHEARDWGLVNEVLPDGKSVVDAAVGCAKLIAANSPDAVIVARQGLLLGWDGMGVEEASRVLLEQFYPQLLASENFAEGLRAFVEKRRPRWQTSKL